jgi:glycosyltransferase involved in cell wall biosynthesis
MIKQKKILFLSEEIPFNRNCGQRVKIYNVLRCLSELYKLTCVFPCRNEKDIKSTQIDSDIKCRKYFIKVPVKDGRLSRRFDILKRRIYLDKKINKKLESIVQEVEPDVAWLEYSYIGQYIPFFKRKNIPTVYVSHNAEAYLNYIGWKLEKSILKKVIKSPVIPLNYLHERLFFPKVDRFLSISEIDMKYYSSFISNSKLSILPNFYIEKDLEGVKEYNPYHKYICMVGSMNSFQNYTGAIVLLKEIWLKIKKRNKNLYLYLIGKLPPHSSDRYRELKSLTEKLPDVFLTGEVEDTIPYVKGALATLVPVLHGSGTRTKIIESVACKTPVVSTTVGAEGLPFSEGKSILIADTPQLFAEKVDKLISDKKLRKSICDEAFHMFEQTLGYEVNRERIRQIIETLSDGELK